MRKVLHKVKSQWVLLGAMVVSLGTADVRQVAASEIEGASTSETLAASVSDNQLSIGQTAKFYIKSQPDITLTNVSIDLRSPENKIHTIYLNYNEEMNMFEGEFYLSDYTETGAWSVNMLQAVDFSGSLVRVYNDDSYSIDSDELNAGDFYINI